MRFTGLAVLAGMIGVSACNVGIDRTPPGCNLLTVKAASYQPKESRIYIRLSDGSPYWSPSDTIYDSWKDKHIGEFEKGSDVIVCPPKHRERTWYVRNNIVGSLGSEFYKVREQASRFENQLPSPQPTWPTYLAENYANQPKPKLSGNDVRLIRKTLALSEPCQRHLLRYTYTSNMSSANVHASFFVLFFASKTHIPHALWTSNIYYWPDTGYAASVPGPLDRKTPEQEIREQPCW
jgi:hypothetical protein